MKSEKDSLIGVRNPERLIHLPSTQMREESRRVESVVNAAAPPESTTIEGQKMRTGTEAPRLGESINVS